MTYATGTKPSNTATRGSPEPAIGVSLPAVIAGLIVAALGFLPIVNWIPGGREALWYPTVAGGWASGTTIAIGLGAVFAILSRKLPFLWHDGALDRLEGSVRSSGNAWVAGVAAVALVLYLVISQAVFSGRPLLIDEIVQVMQARIFAAGRLWVPTDPSREFVSTLLMVDDGPRTYGQFPPGGPAMLALGELLQAPWVVGPVFGAISVLLFGLLLRDVEPRPMTRLLALLLFAFAPFVALMSGTYMNHVTCGAWLLLGILGLVRSTAAAAPRVGWAWVGGLGFGMAGTIRPGDAAAFAIPAAMWWLATAVRDRNRWRHVFAAAAGVVLPAAALLWVNWRTTGAPLKFGYEVLWGKNVGLGFHPSPWGDPHTPSLGLELVNLYFLQLQTHLFESLVPSLVPIIGSLLLTRRLRGPDRYLLVAASAIVSMYFAYWHEGGYLGPRFMYPLAPILALWAGRFPGLVRDRFGAGMSYRTTVFAMAVSLVLGAAMLLPIRVLQYGNGMLTMRWDVDRAAAAAGVRNSLVFVRESWGAQLLARMWHLGVSRSDAERLFRGVDTCVLDEAVSDLERRAAAGPLPPGAATAALKPLLTALLAAVRSASFGQATGPRLQNRPYSPRCLQRIQEEWAGYTVLPPLLLARSHGNIYVRDLHGHNAVMLERYPGRPVYLLTQAPEIGAEPRFFPVAVDSMLNEGSEAVRGTSIAR